MKLSICRLSLYPLLSRQRNFLLLTYVLLLFTQVCLLSALPSYADDKNGVAPNTISLPSGPGSIEGLGEAFQPMLNTGTARYGVTIALPPGTAGQSPQLTLQYDSGYGAGPAGIGWRYGPGFITRQIDKGLPLYVDGDNGLDDDFDNVIDEPDEIDDFVGPDGEELVEVSDNVFRARIEGSFVRYRRVGDYWEADLRNGTTLIFGSTIAARVTDGGGSRIFSWLLEKSTDINGNSIEYSYTSFPGSDNQKYLREIRYGPGSSPWSVFYFIYFSYEMRPDWRIDYRSGFPVRTSGRLAQIDTGIQGASPPMCLQGDWNNDTITDSLIARYILSYTQAQSNISHLSKVTRYGSDGVSYLPPISFEYSTINPGHIISAAGEVITAVNAPVTVMDSELVDLVDLNRDGLPDILRTDLEGSSHTCYLNLGVNEQAITRKVTWASGQSVGNTDGLALQLHLAKDRVSMADMDGDGISDLVHTTDFGDVYYYKNSGGLSWESRKRMSIQDYPPPAPFLLADVETADLDFDKRIDVVQSTDSGYSIWFNLDEGRYSRKVQVEGARHQGQVLRFSASGVQFADMNGDRLSDVAKITPTTVIYSASMGHGNFSQSVSIPIPDSVLEDGAHSQLSRAKLSDVNNDGLADLVVERAASNELWCWLNLGTDTFSGKYIINGMPSQFSPSVAVRWADMNGNGTTDLVYADSTAAERLRIIDIGELLAGSGHGNLLSVIRNGLGVTTSITYRSSTEHYLRDWALGTPWQTSVPFPVQVVSEVEISTGLDNDMIPGIDRYVKEFRYRDGYYEDREKQFRGFAEVQVIEWGDDSAPTRVSRNGFFTGGPDGVDNDGDNDIDEISLENHREEDGLKGLIRFVELRSAGGTIFNREENSWLIRNLLVGQSGIEVRFAYTSESNRFIYEGTLNPETIRTTFVYDDYGNIIQEKNYGALSISGDELFSHNEYINETSNWILGALQRSYQTGMEDITIAETRSYYDGSDYFGLELGSLRKGQLTRQESWVEGTAWVDLVRNSYDIYGNITGTRNGNGYQRTITYDPILHSYPEEEAIEIGTTDPDLTLTAAYNVGLGIVVSSFDFNGNEHRYDHDVFGRLTSVVKPGDSPYLPTLVFTYAMADPDKGLLYTYDKDGTLVITATEPVPSMVTVKGREISGQGGTFDTVRYVDGLGRTLCQVEEGEDGFIVKDAMRFNALGTTRYRYPSYNTTSAAYLLPPPGEPAVETLYDSSGREILINNLPDADDMITSLSTSYNPLQKSVTDENNHTKTFHNNGLERLIRVDEENGGEVYLTRYGYDPLGNLITITDAQDNVRAMEYDGVSRRTLLLDPDRGRMEFTYDAAGNLTQTVDNKEQTIVYTYDGGNRILSEDYLDAANIFPDVAYHYDAGSPDYPAAANTSGKLSWVTDLSGASFFSYDARGNPVWTVKRIDDGGAVNDFQSQATYDAMDRIIIATYPDASTIQYHYNNRSLLESIPGIIKRIDYHSSGQRSLVTYANELTTNYTYDPRYRLQHLRTDFSSPTISPIQDLSYHFDGVSNINEITDNRSLPAIAEENASQSFVYDDLDRLVRAGGPGYGRIDYLYDRIGNMISKQSPADPDPLHIDDPLVNLGLMISGGDGGSSGRGEKLSSTSPGPHAITSTGSGLVFDYDDNGNMIDNDGDIYGWDFRDRLISSNVDGTAASYVYDYSGQRVIKKTAADTNYYISKGYEIRDGKPVRYVFDNTRRVARIETGPQPGEPATQAISLYPGWNFFSINVEPDDSAITTLLAVLDGIYTEVWFYDQGSGQYQGYVPAESRFDFNEIHARRGYIINMAEAATFLVSGTKTAGVIDLEPGWNFISGFVELPTPVSQALAEVVGSCEQIWDFDAAGAFWRNYIPGQPVFLNSLDTIRPGAAHWIKMAETGQLAFQLQQDSIRFYHPDHLGSSSVITDMKGTVVERSEFYPFGSVRHEQRYGFESAFKFTGKERDKKTALDYFEARYYLPIVGKFISVDPLYTESGVPIFNPQELGIYTYALNNPINMVDPTGLVGFWLAGTKAKDIRKAVKVLGNVIKGLGAQGDVRKSHATGESTAKGEYGKAASGVFDLAVSLTSLVATEGSKFSQGLTAVAVFKKGVEGGVALAEGKYEDAAWKAQEATEDVLIATKHPILMAIGIGMKVGNLAWEIDKAYISGGKKSVDITDPKVVKRGLVSFAVGMNKRIRLQQTRNKRMMFQQARKMYEPTPEDLTSHDPAVSGGMCGSNAPDP